MGELKRPEFTGEIDWPLYKLALNDLEFLSMWHPEMLIENADMG